MVRIHFLPEGKTIESEGSETISQIASRGDIAIPHACRQTGRCSTCRVKILQGLSHCSPRSDKERLIARKMAFQPNVRLACQTKVAGDVIVQPLVHDHQRMDFSSIYIKNNPPDLFGIEKHMFILFADIRNFTAFSEHFMPYDVIYVLNYYFYEMGEVIKRNGGVIDNYMGDAFLALFEADDPVEGAYRATRAALEMLETVRHVIRPNHEGFLNEDFRIGIGLHYGLVVAGTIGDNSNKRLTVIGDAVNYASRIESANKQTGTEFLISEDAFALIRQRVRINRSFTIALKGKSGQHNLYEVVSLN